MLEKGLANKLSQYVFFATYMLIEWRKPQKEREFAAFLDLLPSVREFPVHFTDEDLKALAGSPLNLML